MASIEDSMSQRKPKTHTISGAIVWSQFCISDRQASLVNCAIFCFGMAIANSGESKTLLLRANIPTPASHPWLIRELIAGKANESELHITAIFIFKCRGMG